MKKIICSILFFLSIPLGLLAQDIATRKHETFGIVGFSIALGIFILIVYSYYMYKKSKTPVERYKVKTYEVIKNGRKVIMTKKYRVVEEQEFPNELKRSTRPTSA